MIAFAMIRKHALKLLFIIGASSAAAQGGPSPAASTSPARVSLAKYLPPETVVFAELLQPSKTIQQFTGGALLHRIQQLESYGEFIKGGDGLRFVTGLAAARAAIGVDLSAAIDGSFGSRVAVSIVPPREKDKKPGFLMLSEAKDRAMLLKMRDALSELAGYRSMGEWDESRVRVVKQNFKQLGDVEIINLTKESWHAISGSTLILANELSLVTDTLTRLSRATDGGADTLANNTRLASAAFLAGDADGFVWIDLDAVVAKMNPDLRSNRKLLQPAEALLVGGMQQSILDSSWISGSFTLDENALSLRMQTSAIPTKSRATFDTKGAAVADVAIPRRLGSLVLRRDINSFWNDHEGLVAAELDAEFAKFNSTAATIFGVKRMDEDVFPKLAPIAQFVFARQEFADAAAAPKLKIPGVAMILQVNEDIKKEETKKIGEGFRRAFQTAVALSAADAAQKERPAFGLSEETVDHIKISFATYPEYEEKGPADTAYNFSPAYFTKGKYLVISTTHELARDLLKSIRDGGAAAARDCDTFEVSGSEMAAALRENAEYIIANEVLEKGKTKNQATRELGAFVDLISMFSKGRASTFFNETGLAAELSLYWNNGATTVESRPRGVDLRPRRVDR